MEEKTLIIKKLKEGLYLFNDAYESSAFLVIGTEKACFIDTMSGYHDYLEEIKKITDKPLVVVNTHGHPDHIYGNIFFDKVYINSADLSLVEEFSSSPDFKALCDKFGKTMPQLENIKEGDIIELGDKTLNVYDLPGHTPGGIVLLCPEERILFSGDSINHHLWMQVPGSSLISEFVENLERIMFLKKEADVILHGHAMDYDDISLMQAVFDGAKDIVAGRNDADSDYNWFGGVAKQHPFKVDETKHFQQSDHVICYQVDRIK